MTAKKRQRNDTIPGVTTIIEDGEVVGEEPAEERLEVKKTKGGALVFDESPFLRGFSIDTRKKSLTVSRGTAVLQPGTDKQVQGVTTVEQIVEVDKKQFVKMFSGPDLKHVYNLTSAGLRMFMVLLDAVGRPSMMNNVHVRLTWPIVRKLTEDAEEAFSYSSFNRGIKDLIDKEYIAAAIINGETDGWYWFNQDRVYNGDTVILKQKIRLAKENKKHPARVIHSEPVAQTGDLFDDTFDAGN